MGGEVDFFEVLGVSRNASEEVIRAAYKALARKYHPDINPDDPVAEDRFKEVQQAYNELGDPRKRREHLEQLKREEILGRAAEEAKRREQEQARERQARAQGVDATAFGDAVRQAGRPTQPPPPPVPPRPSPPQPKPPTPVAVEAEGPQVGIKLGNLALAAASLVCSILVWQLFEGVFSGVSSEKSNAWIGYLFIPTLVLANGAWVLGSGFAVLAAAALLFTDEPQRLWLQVIPELSQEGSGGRVILRYVAFVVVGLFAFGVLALLGNS